MRIHMNVKDENKKRRIFLWLPNCLVTSAPAAWVIDAAVNRTPSEALKRRVNLSYGDIRALQNELRRCRRLLRGRPLVEVHSHDGQHVTIRM